MKKHKVKIVIEQYGCGCSIGPIRKSEALGYCSTHGESVLRVYEHTVGFRGPEFKENDVRP